MTHTIQIARDDVLAAWAVLENLAVSFDQIGSAYCGVAGHHAEQPRLQEALAAYLQPALLRAISEARLRLGQYISAEEAEAFVEKIAYWDYATLPRKKD